MLTLYLKELKQNFRLSLPFLLLFIVILMISNEKNPVIFLFPIFIFGLSGWTSEMYGGLTRLTILPISRIKIPIVKYLVFLTLTILLILIEVSIFPIIGCKISISFFIAISFMLVLSHMVFYDQYLTVMQDIIRESRLGQIIRYFVVVLSMILVVLTIQFIRGIITSNSEVSQLIFSYHWLLSGFICLSLIIATWSSITNSHRKHMVDQLDMVFYLANNQRIKFQRVFLILLSGGFAVPLFFGIMTGNFKEDAILHLAIPILGAAIFPLLPYMNQQADGTISRFFTLPMKRRTVMIGFFLPAVLYTLGLVIPNLLWMNLIYPEKFVLSAKTIFEIQLICFSIMTFTWWFANSAIVFLHTRYTKVDLAVGLLGLIPVVAILLLTFFFSNAFYQFVKSHSDLIHTLGVTPLPFYLLLNLIYMRR